MKNSFEPYDAVISGTSAGAAGHQSVVFQVRLLFSNVCSFCFDFLSLFPSLGAIKRLDLNSYKFNVAITELPIFVTKHFQVVAFSE